MVHVTYLDDTQVAIVYENFIHTLGMVNQQNMNTHCLFKISLWSTTTSFWYGYVHNNKFLTPDPIDVGNYMHGRELCVEENCN